jgi:hypothetical protein
MAALAISEENKALARRLTDDLDVDVPRYQTRGKKKNQYHSSGYYVFFWAVKTEFLKSEFKRLRSTKSVNAL